MHYRSKSSIDALRYTVEPISLHGEKVCAEAV